MNKPEDIVRFEPGATADLTNPLDPVGWILFGDRWPGMCAKPSSPSKGGTLTVTSIDHESGAITVDK